MLTVRHRGAFVVIDFFRSSDYLGMMFLSPLWVALVSVPCVYAAARYTRNGLVTLFVSFCFVLSGTVVLFSFSRLTAKVIIADLGGLLILEVDRLSVLSSLLFLACAIPFLMYYLQTLDRERLPGNAALVHLLVSSALGSFFAANLLSFTMFFEAVPLLALALVALESKADSSSYQYLLYFVPFPILLLFTGLATGRVSPSASGYLNVITLHPGATLLLAVVFAARLLLFPFGWPAVKCLPLNGRSAASYALFSLPVVTLLALLKFLPYSRFLGQAMLVLAAFSMVVWALLCYRQTKSDNVTLFAYLAQTAVVAVMVVYLLLYVGSRPDVYFLVIGNHVMSSLGLLVCASLDDEKRGRLGNAGLFFFAFCMLGLPPSPGFAGRLALFRTSFSATDLPAYLLRLSFVVNLFIVYCQSRYLASIIDRLKVGPKSPRSLTVALLLLGGCLLFAMLFTGQVKHYLANV